MQSRTKGIFVLCAVAVLLAPVLYFARDLNARKSWLESTASAALGMEARIGGSAKLGFIPLRVTAEDIHVRNLGSEIVSARAIELGIAFFPLLRGEVQFGKVALEHARIAIERGRDGRYNFEREEEADGQQPVLDLPAVTLSEASLVYADAQSGGGLRVDHCRVDAGRLHHPGGKRGHFLAQLSLHAEVACGEFHANNLAASDLKFSINGKRGVFTIEPATMRAFSGRGSGILRIDRSESVQQARVHFTLSKFRVEEYFKAMSADRTASGDMDFTADLDMSGVSRADWRKTAKGTVNLQGRALTLQGIDLDKELDEYRKSQSFNLIDVSAFFLAGPIGLTVTKGRDFGSLLQQSAGNTDIRVLVSTWQVDSGMARTGDVALATKKNRLALKGALDLVNERYEDLTAALIDPQGCPLVTQKIHGSFRAPSVDKPNVLVALAGPMLNLLNKAKDMLSPDQCKVFYAGSVAPPK